MKLSVLEQQLLTVAEFRGFESVAWLASQAKLKPHVVHYILEKLGRCGVIKRRAYIDSYLLGTRPFILFANIRAEGEKYRSALIDFLYQDSRVSFVAQLTGRWNLYIEIRADDLFQLEPFFDELASKFPGLLHDREVLAMPFHAEFSTFGEGKLRQSVGMVSSKVSNRVLPVDKIDSGILKAISMDWSLSERALAAKLRIPASTISYRIERLRREGLILASRYWIDLAALGYYRFLHLISLKSNSEKQRTALCSFAREHAGVSTVRSLIGSWDFIFETHHRSPEMVSEFTKAMHERFSDDILDRHTMSVLVFRKTSDCTIPLSAEAQQGGANVTQTSQ